ncbi:ATP-binding cassette domain-containing protein [Streptomyces spinoverrucosus]|uniref:ATP-binding cassette domain-containing protein n=1 Tax=Streptomyces spinoverrucosus TaxID=284043 RepID=UPI0018C3D4A7|nr:ATP-binding cassette domain-containing protein [Streptomyces spinoverrucosus]MBG0856020.1 ATP-binding cassette domain-containing protein [Streptomyces spinoverrucosus]
MAGLAVTARDFGLRGPRGWAFRGISFAAEPGSLIAIEGPSGSGRTSLLLALTGRMKATEGMAEVGDARLPKQLAALRRVSALAHVPGVTDLDPALTVGEHLRERALLERRFGVSLRGLLRPRAERAKEAGLRIDAALSDAGLDRDALPKGSRTAVRDLERVEALRLSVALALVGRPRLLGVDDTDLKLSDAERGEVWALLRSLTEAGTTVVAVCSEAPGDAVVVSTERAGSDVPEKSGADGLREGDDEDADPGGAGGGASGERADEENEDDEDDEPGRDGLAVHDDAKEAADAFAEAGRA